MSYSDQLLQGTSLTEQAMLRDFEALSLYYEDMQIPSKTVEASPAAPLPTLVAMVDSPEEDKPWIFTHSFLPLDNETAEFTKFLQFYCEVPGSLEEIDRLTLLEGVNRLNQVLPMGAVLLVEPRPELELPLMAAVRAVQGFPLDQPIDQGVFTGDMILMEEGGQMVVLLMDALRAGKTVSEAFDELIQ